MLKTLWYNTHIAYSTNTRPSYCQTRWNRTAGKFWPSKEKGTVNKSLTIWPSPRQFDNMMAECCCWERCVHSSYPPHSATVFVIHGDVISLAVSVQGTTLTVDCMFVLACICISFILDQKPSQEAQLLEVLCFQSVMLLLWATGKALYKFLYYYFYQQQQTQQQQTQQQQTQQEQHKNSKHNRSTTVYLVWSDQSCRGLDQKSDAARYLGEGVRFQVVLIHNGKVGGVFHLHQFNTQVRKPRDTLWLQSKSLRWESTHFSERKCVCWRVPLLECRFPCWVSAEYE